MLRDEHLNVCNDLKLRSVLEAISCASVKKGALFSNPFTQTPILLLGGRGLYLSDKAKVAAAIAREKKAKKRLQKKLLHQRKSRETLHVPLIPKASPGEQFLMMKKRERSAF